MKSLAEQLHDANGAVALLEEQINEFMFDDVLALRVDDWFVDYYDNSIELVLQQGWTPADFGDRLDAKAREWGFRLIHFKGFPSKQSRGLAPV